MIGAVNFFIFLTQIRFRSEKSFNMTSLALIFVIFLNCMLCARCELTKSTAKWAHGINSVFIGDKITHKELEVGPPFAQKEDMSLNDDLSLLKIIVQNTGKDV